MIPKVFHRIWLGGKPLPREFERYGRTWLDHHPGWHMQTWTEWELPPSRYPELIKACPHPARAANILRYELIAREGGIYLDTDFECLRPISSLISGLDAFTAYQLDQPVVEGSINNAFFGAVPGHPFLLDLIDELPRRDLLKLGPHTFTDVVHRHPEVHVFPRKLFYPYLWTEPRPAVMPAESYAVHHWSMTWR